MSNSRECPNCGQPILTDNQPFCAFCGASLSASNDGSLSNRKTGVYAPTKCATCGKELTFLNRSLDRDLCVTCYGRKVWKTVKPFGESAIETVRSGTKKMEAMIKPPDEQILEQLRDRLDADESFVAIVSGWHTFKTSEQEQQWMGGIATVGYELAGYMPSEAQKTGPASMVWSGYLVATTKRMIVYKKRPDIDQEHSYPLSKISGIRLHKGRLCGISFLAGDTEEDLWGCKCDDASKLVNFVEDSILRLPATAPAQPLAPTSTQSLNVLGELERLAQLFDKGLITEDEFQKLKQELMSRPNIPN